MLGSAISFTGYLLVLFVLNIWIVVRIWKRSPLLAVLAFFFWPLSIVALFLNWGDEESDIRIPFLLSLVVGALMVFMAMRTVEKGVEEMAYMLTDEDIALIREDDPELAQRLEAARAEQLAEGDGDWSDEEGSDDAEAADEAGFAIREDRSIERDDSPGAEAATPAARDPAAIEAEHRANLERAAGAIAWQFRSVALPGADASVRLPQHFRFAPRASLLYVARLRGMALPSDVVGWVVHRDVSLAREDAWFVQVRQVQLASPLPMSEPLGDADAREAGAAALVGRIATALDATKAPPRAPAWDAGAAVATWERSAAGVDADAPFADYVAARVLPRALVEFSVPALHAAHAQLGVRASRMLAQRVDTAPAAPAR
ncbi:hypothetical protein [Chiayiivirga flava]|uniref:Uncharacterized protein n=1 Tax=Chiayiivirga flava TaxID=659595 RepID=A0A7W8G0Z0_9GAMM|nr:hypothetical protein [Chiayiivirga flava]MBB5209661.1 hypothetical protein [Chiayiivirga flava]